MLNALARHVGRFSEVTSEIGVNKSRQHVMYWAIGLDTLTRLAVGMLETLNGWVGISKNSMCSESLALL
jgi:hypothetical protein